MSRTITPTKGGKLTLNVDTYHAIRAENHMAGGWRGGGRIEFSPPPEELNRGAPPGVSREAPNTFYLDGTWVELEAVPDEGYKFMGWGGMVSGKNPFKTLLMDGFQSVTAFFSRLPFPEKIQAGPPVRAHPRAFTFIAGADDPESQRFRLTNIGDGLLDYRIDSDRYWLEAVPQQGILDEGESVEIEVTAINYWMPPETYTGELTVVPQNDYTTVWTPYGPIKRIKSSEVFTIPVTFAVIQSVVD